MKISYWCSSLMQQDQCIHFENEQNRSYGQSVGRQQPPPYPLSPPTAPELANDSHKIEIVMKIIQILLS